MPRSKGSAAAAPCFVDDQGGAFAALAAGIARARGQAGALAATTSPAVAVPAEIGVVLGEIAATIPEVALASSVRGAAERIDVGGWGLTLHEGEGDLERLSAARIARDRIERRFELGGSHDGGP